MGSDKIYIAIDLKSFYASVEAVDLGLDPLTANLVVADPSRTERPSVWRSHLPEVLWHFRPGQAV